MSELHASFTILEQLGKVPEDKRLSNDPVWLGHVSSWKLELEMESRPPRSAKPYTTALVLSLELFVLDLEQELYFRFIAWVALISCWTAMRLDDVQNMLPDTMKLSKRGFSCRLSRTKTTGPGKLHGQVAVFVRRDISLSGYDWLGTGLELTNMNSFLTKGIIWYQPQMLRLTVLCQRWLNLLLCPTPFASFWAGLALRSFRMVFGVQT